MNWISVLLILTVSSILSKAGAVDFTFLPRQPFANENWSKRTFSVRKLPFAGQFTEVYVYTDQNERNRNKQYDQKILEAAAYFDQTVYPRYMDIFNIDLNLRQLAGEKIILLFDYDLPYTVWHSKDLPKNYNREFILIDIEANLESDALAYRLPHELQHIVRNHFNSGEEDWLNEGLSVFTEYYVNQKFPTKYLKDHREIGGLPLFFKYQLGISESHYFNNFLFVYYLYKHYGGLPLIRKLMISPQTGFQNIEAAFKNLPKPSCINYKFLNFQSAFQNFQLALILNKYHQELNSECNLFDLDLNSENVPYDLRNYSVDAKRLKESANFEMQAARSLYLNMPAPCVTINYTANSGLIPVVIDMSNTALGNPIRKLESNKIYCIEELTEYNQYLLIINSSPTKEHRFSITMGSPEVR